MGVTFSIGWPVVLKVRGRTSATASISDSMGIIRQNDLTIQTRPIRNNIKKSKQSAGLICCTRILDIKPLCVDAITAL